jgi:hypothetical protein
LDEKTTGQDGPFLGQNSSGFSMRTGAVYARLWDMDERPTDEQKTDGEAPA